MTKNQGAAVIVILYVIMLACILIWVQATFSHDSLDQIKIDCFLHRDNPDVHKLCVDHRYDH